jgi:hypothetical protein
MGLQNLISIGFLAGTLAFIAHTALAQSISHRPAAGCQAGDERRPPYCEDLKHVIALASTKERFGPISGRPREGNFFETSLTLTGWNNCSLYGATTGWNNCSLYGATTHTCDSPAHRTADEADHGQALRLDELKACLGNAWTEAKERSSPKYVVLHNAARPISITLSTDQTDKNEHVVHLILFVRRN